VHGEVAEAATGYPLASLFIDLSLSLPVSCRLPRHLARSRRNSVNFLASVRIQPLDHLAQHESVPLAGGP